MEIISDTISSENKFRFETPVRLMLWTRPDFLERQFEVVRKARPHNLIVVSDYGRNEDEIEEIEKSRKIVSKIDWECNVYKIYWNENQGMYSTWIQASEFIWNKFERCIFLEDDDIPSESFFFFCEEMLHKYENDQRIQCICGMNSVGIYENCNCDYFFSKEGSIWGIALWKRTYMQFSDFEYANDKYTIDMINTNISKQKCFLRKNVEEVVSKKTVEGHIPGAEYYLRLGTYLHNQLKIVPKYNLISNIGCDERAAHSHNIDYLPRRIQKLYHLSTYEYKFPLNHPKYVIEDKKYESIIDSIFARENRFQSILRKFDFIIRRIKYGSMDEVITALKRQLFGNRER